MAEGGVTVYLSPEESSGTRGSRSSSVQTNSSTGQPFDDSDSSPEHPQQDQASVTSQPNANEDQSLADAVTEMGSASRAQLVSSPGRQLAQENTSLFSFGSGDTDVTVLRHNQIVRPSTLRHGYSASTQSSSFGTFTGGSSPGYPHENTRTIYRQSAIPEVQSSLGNINDDGPSEEGSNNTERQLLIPRTQSVKLYKLFSLYLTIPVLVLVTGLYVMSDLLCTDSFLCMRITVCAGLVSAIVALLVAAWYERKYRSFKQIFNGRNLYGTKTIKLYFATQVLSPAIKSHLKLRISKPKNASSLPEP